MSALGQKRTLVGSPPAAYLLRARSGHSAKPLTASPQSELQTLLCDNLELIGMAHTRGNHALEVTGGISMTTRPDPTFHASPKLAMEAPPENFAYTLLLSPDFSK